MLHLRDTSKWRTNFESLFLHTTRKLVHRAHFYVGFLSAFQIHSRLKSTGWLGSSTSPGSVRKPLAQLSCWQHETRIVLHHTSHAEDRQAQTQATQNREEAWHTTSGYAQHGSHVHTTSRATAPSPTPSQPNGRRKRHAQMRNQAPQCQGRAWQILLIWKRILPSQWINCSANRHWYTCTSI